MVTQSKDQLPAKYGGHEAHSEGRESLVKINNRDTADGNICLWCLVISFIIYLFKKECYQSTIAGAENLHFTLNGETRRAPGAASGRRPYSLGRRRPEKWKVYETEVELQRRIEELQETNEKLQEEIDRRKTQYKLDWKKAKIYADWRKEEFQTVNVTLDADTAHPVLLLCEKGRQVTWQESCQALPSSTQRFDSFPCVLGQPHISSGRCFWEVEVGDKGSWDVGICRDNVTRKGRVTMSPQYGFWTIRCYGEEFWAITSPETQLILREYPHRVGIFLDYEAGDVSFYNMIDGSHIFTFPQTTFQGVLRPLFRLWSSDSGPLTIV
ncbi:butyrophilin subfamily 1 member A1-like isoform X2 [Castor canadensis]|uniref:Butyrophilin subfamily 1 member A1-like isoform X2 n=1 Tax=Castor canadensis TaxID=51338 RepID=A0AC58N819_CASCN